MINSKYARLDTRLHRILKIHSANTNVSMTQIINELVANYIDVNNLEIYISDDSGE